ncbi:MULTISPECIES: AAA family ATPase [Halomonadaceae]|jgi:pilus assembly protein CpaE|uniref:P-loop NTPase n=1 Tax=Billgrantia aerodenitrificans TaxID=2733483 RepID=A0ABS9ATL3_9GAMM|nr:MULTISPECIES: AAA family ATPase [Halomonas]MCE8025022.1 P-loop NTPase [Halomonas aerodenitrificans]MCE8037009.1 P-loop NTPase [Halomonas sp. MCCC 1A11062]
MLTRLEIRLVGRSRADMEALEALLRSQGGIDVTLRQLINGNVDPLEDVETLPDALVLMVGECWEAELLALCERPVGERPPLLVVGPKGNVELIRLAMRAGARDYFSPPIDDGEIGRFLREIVRDRREEQALPAASLTAVINAKGGSGASLVAANLAHRLAVEGKECALVDMDVQFGSLPLYFNLTPDHGLVQALDAADSLDSLAMSAYVQQHESGLGLLASSPEDRVSLAEVPEIRVEQLLHVLGQDHEEVVVDLPRWINGATACVLERADRVLMVMQQSVAHLHDAQRLRDILIHELGLPPARLTVVVNRYDKRNEVSLGAIGDALPRLPIHTLPNDYRHASQSINVGSPLIDLARKAPLTRAIKALALALTTPREPPAPARRWSLRLWNRTQH